MAVNQVTRRLVHQRAKYLCEYCHSPERSNATPFTLDHLVPQSLGGSDELDNLALACHRCNVRRYNFTIGVDPQTQLEVPLFNPRKQQWSDHFVWTTDGIRILGTTATGRATSNRLDFNDEFHDDGFIQLSRQVWIEGGWHPPQEDPLQAE